MTKRARSGQERVTQAVANARICASDIWRWRHRELGSCFDAEGLGQIRSIWIAPPLGISFWTIQGGSLLSKQFQKAGLRRAGKPACPVGDADGTGAVLKRKIEFGQNIVSEFILCLLR